MAFYKRAPAPQTVDQDSINPKYRTQVEKLSELFPGWSDQDLSSLLTEVNGDADLAATRISEGRAEQWSVSKKKEKKVPQTASQSFKSDRDGQSARGAFRGARGGRGGGRGGARAPRADRPPHANGHKAASPPAAPDYENPVDLNAWGLDEPVSVTPATDEPTATDAFQGEADPAPTPLKEPEPSPAPVHPPPTNGTSSYAKPVQKLPAKPAASKLSWAQIARPQEKPKPVPAPVVQSSPQPPAPLIPERPPTPEPAVDHSGWEEGPTTVQAPTWDDEPVKPPAPPEPANDGWVTTEHVSALPPPTVIPEAWDAPAPKQTPAQEHVWPSAPSEPSPRTAPSSTLSPPGISQPSLPTTATSSKPSTPGLRPGAQHRTSARFKGVGDQAVVMPGHQGPFGVERVGMQFGSLSLSGDEPVPAPAELTPAPEPEPKPQPAEPPAQPQPVQAPPEVTTPAPAPPAPQQHPLPQAFAPQPQAPGFAHHAHSYSQHGLPTHIEHPIREQQQQQQPYYGQQHAATPPVQEPSPYGGFSPLGGQFAEYGYEQQQRGFYDAYGHAQSGAFSGRGLPDELAKQQPQQSQQQPQAQQQPQQPGQAQQQQGGPFQPQPPMGAYYYNPYYMQNQFYGQPPAPPVPPAHAQYAAPAPPFVKYPPPAPAALPRQQFDDAPFQEFGKGVGVGMGVGSGMHQQGLYGLQQHHQQHQGFQREPPFRNAPQSEKAPPQTPQQPSTQQQQQAPPPAGRGQAQTAFYPPSRFAGAGGYGAGAGVQQYGQQAPAQSQYGGQTFGGQQGVGQQYGDQPTAAPATQQQQPFYGGYQPRHQQQYWQ